MKDGCFEHYSRLLLGESWADAYPDLEHAAVEMGHRPTEICDLPYKGIVFLDQVNIKRYHLVALVKFDHLFETALEIGC